MSKNKKKTNRDNKRKIIDIGCANDVYNNNVVVL